MTFEEAKTLLSTCNRAELRDKAFGDKEVYFSTEGNSDVAEGYVGNGQYTITVGDDHFEGSEAYELLNLGTLVSVERNDSLDDEEFDYDYE